MLSMTQKNGKGNFNPSGSLTLSGEDSKLTKRMASKVKQRSTVLCAENFQIMQISSQVSLKA